LMSTYSKLVKAKLVQDTRPLGSPGQYFANMPLSVPSNKVFFAVPGLQ